MLIGTQINIKKKTYPILKTRTIGVSMEVFRGQRDELLKNKTYGHPTLKFNDHKPIHL